jgi:organic hydroperoxide reductase OsmC/OhrA
MQEFPHHYRTAALLDSTGHVAVTSEGLPTIETDSPREFGGPGDRWSPETLLLAAVADCFLLSFRAIAKASKFVWHSLSCEVEGTLDKVDRVVQFTALHLTIRLTTADHIDVERADRLIRRAEQS